MQVVHVLRVKEEEPEGYRGVFPDVAGLQVHAHELPLLQVRAREALQIELQRLEAAGLDWPEAPTLAALHSTTGSLKGLHLLVDVTVDDAPMRVNITLPTQLLKRLDDTVERLDMTRSGYIAASVRERLERASVFSADEPFVQRVYAELTRVGGQLNDSFGPQSNLERLWSELDQRALDGLKTLFGRLSRNPADREGR